MQKKDEIMFILSSIIYSLSTYENFNILKDSFFPITFANEKKNNIKF